MGPRGHALLPGLRAAGRARRAGGGRRPRPGRAEGRAAAGHAPDGSRRERGGVPRRARGVGRRGLPAGGRRRRGDGSRLARAERGGRQAARAGRGGRPAGGPRRRPGSAGGGARGGDGPRRRPRGRAGGRRRGRGRGPPLLPRAALRALRPPLPARHARHVLVQQRRRRLRELPRLRSHHRRGLGPRLPGSEEVAGRRRHQALGRQVDGLGAPLPEEAGAGGGRVDDRARRVVHRGGVELAARGRRRRVARRLGGPARLVQVAGDPRLQDARPRAALALPQLRPLPGVWRRAAEAGVAGLEARRPEHRGALRAARRRGAALRGGAHGGARRRRRDDAPPARVPEPLGHALRRRARVPHPRSRQPDAQRRRVAAGGADRRARRVADGRDVRARRADGGPAPGRRGAALGRGPSPGRGRQHGGGGRARPRDDPQRRAGDRARSRRRGAGRRGGLRRVTGSAGGRRHRHGPRAPSALPRGAAGREGRAAAARRRGWW